MQTAIPCLFMRGGTSRGPFFHAADLPADVADPRQGAARRDGLARQAPDRRAGRRASAHQQGRHRLEAAAARRRSRLPVRAVAAGQGHRSTPRPTAATCSPRWCRSRSRPAWCKPQGDTTTLRVLTLNTDMQCDITVQTPGGRVEYEGDARIDGVPGTAAPIKINFLDTAGSVAPGLLPTGHVRDRRSTASSVDDLHRQRHAAGDHQGRRPGPHRLRERRPSSTRTPSSRRGSKRCGSPAATPMGLGDVTAKNYPKMTLISRRRAPAAPSPRAASSRTSATTRSACWRR